MPTASAMPASLEPVSRCWNNIYQSLAKTRKKYEEMKVQNPNISIIVGETSASLKERFLELIELVLAENRALNKTGGKSVDALDWKYGGATEYFLRNDVLGTIVSYVRGNDMPRDLVDEVAYLIASLAHSLPPSFLINEAVHRPVGQFLEVLLVKPSRYSVVLCDKLVARVEEYAPLYSLLSADRETFCRVLALLYDIPEACPYMTGLIVRLLKLELPGFEQYMMAEAGLLALAMERFCKSFELIQMAGWSTEQITAFVQQLKIFDSLVQSLGDDSRLAVAVAMKAQLVQTKVGPALRGAKLADGSVAQPLELLSLVLDAAESVEICFPLLNCYKQAYFAEGDADCINLGRLFFAEGEMALSLSVVRLLGSVVGNPSRSLLAVFQPAGAAPPETHVVECEAHQQMCQAVVSMLGALPEQVHDRSPENAARLYKAHLIVAEQTVPEEPRMLNHVDDGATIFCSLVIKAIDAFAMGFWGRAPQENLEVCRFFLALVSLSDTRFVYGKLLGADAAMSLIEIGKTLLGRTGAAPLKEHMEQPETRNSVAKFRASLYEGVRKDQAGAEDMFQPGGLLQSLLAGMEAKTVGALSGNVLLFSCFYQRLLATIQVQSTRPFKSVRFI